jgi:hypothetical protein
VRGYIELAVREHAEEVSDVDRIVEGCNDLVGVRYPLVGMLFSGALDCAGQIVFRLIGMRVVDVGPPRGKRSGGSSWAHLGEVLRGDGGIVFHPPAAPREWRVKRGGVWFAVLFRDGCDCGLPAGDAFRGQDDGPLPDADPVPG